MINREKMPRCKHLIENTSAGVLLCAVLLQMDGWNRHGCFDVTLTEKECPIPELAENPDDQLVRAAVVEKVFAK